MPDEQSGLSAALSEAQNIVNAAKQRAEELLSEAEAIHAKAYEEGYQQGITAGKSEATQVAVRLIEDTDRVRTVLSEEAANLALSISASVIAEQLSVDPELVKRIARNALQEAVIGDSAKFIVHPDDRDAIEQGLEDLAKLTPRAALSVETDSAVGRGGVLVITEFGEVDATIDTLLDSVASRIGVARSLSR